MTEKDETADLPSTPVDEYAAWWDAWRTAKANEAAWKRIADEAKEKCLAPLKANNVTVGTVNGKPLYGLKVTTYPRLDSKALKAKDPETWAKFAVDTRREEIRPVDDD